jgi:hypothetical protein
MGFSGGAAAATAAATTAATAAATAATAAANTIAIANNTTGSTTSNANTTAAVANNSHCPSTRRRGATLQAFLFGNYFGTSGGKKSGPTVGKDRALFSRPTKLARLLSDNHEEELAQDSRTSALLSPSPPPLGPPYSAAFAHCLAVGDNLRGFRI